MCVPDSTLASGFRVYMCKTTHPATALTFQADIANWEEVSENFSSAYFNYIIAKNAHFEFGSSNQLVIYDSQNNIVAGLTGDIPDEFHEDDSVRIWAGGSNPSIAPFRVQQDGQFYSNKAHIQGLVEVKGTQEGVIVYDDDDNIRAQIVSGEIDEPVSETITITGSKQQSSFSTISSGRYLSLTPTPISISLGELKAGAGFRVGGYMAVSYDGGSTKMRLTANNGVVEAIHTVVTLLTSNANVVGQWVLHQTSPVGGCDVEDFSYATKDILIPETANYYLSITSQIENINTDNTASNTFGGIKNLSNITLTSTVSYSGTHATPIGTRIGTNGMFVNLGTNTNFFIKQSGTDIRYGNYRLRINSQGLYASINGVDYYPFVKKTKQLEDADFTNSTYEVKADDGVLFLNNSNPVTLTLTSSSSKEIKIISKSGTTYALSGSPVYRCNGDAAQTFGVSDKKARMFVKDTLGNYFEFYCCN
jgi:hypothetical protein